MERSVIVDPALVNVRSGKNQKFEDFIFVGAIGRKRGNQRRKPGVVLVIGVGAQFEKRPDERRAGSSRWRIPG